MSSKKIFAFVFRLGLSFVLMIFTTMQSNAQNYILAGQHTTTDVYFDYNPDTAINAVVNGSAAILSIDLNLDGTQDFLLHASVGSNPFGGNDNIRIIPLGQNSIAYDFEDSCINGGGTLLYTRQMAKSFTQGYYIGPAGYWLNDTVHLHYNTYSNPGTACNNSVNIDFTGIRIISGQDTLYGWIKLSYTIYGNITVQDYACNLPTISKQDEKSTGSFYFFPNPANQQIQLNFSSSQSASQVQLYNSTGAIVKDLPVIGMTNYIMDVSALVPGIYFLSVKLDSGQTLHKKIIIGT